MKRITVLSKAESGSHKLGGAEVACRAHNPKVTGSKPVPAIIKFIYSNPNQIIRLKTLRLGSTPGVRNDCTVLDKLSRELKPPA